jgi:hypothetical protein
VKGLVGKKPFAGKHFWILLMRQKYLAPAATEQELCKSIAAAIESLA